jgi:hypothetical protein
MVASIPEFSLLLISSLLPHWDWKTHSNYWRQLHLQIDNNLNWKNRSDHMIPQLCKACYAMWTMFHINNTDNPKSIILPTFYSIMKYRNFLVNCYIKVIFTSQERNW